MELYQIVMDFCEAYGYEYRNDYSGRGMYGATCVGFTCSNVNRALMEFGGFVVVNGADLDDFIFCLSTDRLGYGAIVYFTSIEDESEDCEDEDEDYEDED